MEKYKPSGIDWLGNIPAEWEVKRLKTAVSRLYKGKGITKDEVLATGKFQCVRYGEIYTKYQIYFNQCISKTNIPKEGTPSYFSHGDLLFAGTGELISEIGKCIAYLGNEKCMAGGDIIIANHNNNPLFMAFALNSAYVQNQKSSSKIKLKVVHISASDIGNLIIALPPLAEQKAIAEYLDEKCGAIDRAVTAGKELVECLKERKQILITRAVTRGVRKSKNSRPLKNSGIDWLGNIPSEWEVIKTSYVFHKIGSGTTPESSNTRYYDVAGIPFLQTGDLNDGIVSDTATKITKYALENCRLKIYTKGSLVIALYGATIGKLGILDLDTTVNQAACVLSQSKKMLTRFAFYTFLACKKSLLLESKGGGQPNISQETIRRWRIPVPPLAEQKEIAEYLDEKCGAIDRAVEMQLKEIELLQERKQILINEVVTGKRRVV